MKRWWAWLGVLFLAGCSPSEDRMSYQKIEPPRKERVPVTPHVVAFDARPTMSMSREKEGAALRFRYLDKRTWDRAELEAVAGSKTPAPWGGLEVVAYVPDLLIYEGVAEHGPKNHVNPAVWVVVRDEGAKPLFEGWLFARDPALTAWDHERFDLSFVGEKREEKAAPPVATGSEPEIDPKLERD